MQLKLFWLRGTGMAALAMAGAAGLRADDWPQWLGPERDSVWRETRIVNSFPASGSPVVWRTAIGSGYSGPAVALGRVYVLDRQVAKASAPATNALERTGIPGAERIICLNADDGKVLWQREYNCPYTVAYPAGPRTTPVVSEGKVFSLGAEGNLFCLDAATGDVVWSRDFKEDYKIKTPMWGFAGNPLLEGNKLICLAGGSNSTVVALDRNTGREIWRGLSAKEPGYCSPVIFQAGGVRQLIVWHPESVNSLDPETGQVYWSLKSSEPVRAGMTIATPRQMGDWLFLTCFYNGSWMLRLDASQPAAATVWQSQRVSEVNTDALHSTLSTPFLQDGYIYGVCSYGQLRCLKAASGERVWETLGATTDDGKPMRWANAFIVKNQDRFFLFNEKGDLIIARMTPQGYEEISRAHVIAPANRDTGRAVVWSHPAFANRRMYARNDQEILCVDLAQK
ncbi:MAG: PQQ-binding-like beta-propeller repeat protein [Verrucomicrobiota bacterium]|jgi:outer membrane protein assembly factor BamB